MSKIRHYIARQELPVDAQAAFHYHDRPGALNRLIPPWESVKVEHSDQSLKPGSRVILKASAAGIPVRWVAEHTDYEPPKRFCDTQLSGPFSLWNHQHCFSEINDSTTDAKSVLTDQIEYRLPLGGLGDLFGSGKALKTIEAMFAYRHRITQNDLQLYSRYDTQSLSIAISGSSGLVGQSLSNMLGLFGHQVKPIVRRKKQTADEQAPWSESPEDGTLSGFDAVVHLAGKSIASGRWNAGLKKEIQESRVKKTRQLCELLASRKQPPKVLVCASATGIYGNRGEETLDEESHLGQATTKGSGFLVEVGKQWEEACRPAIDAGIRVVHARFGIILSPKGGALQKMLTPAKLLGGALGSGKQWWSWISLDDAIGGIYHCIKSDELDGPVNFVSPNPIQNKEFVNTLGQAISRPAIFPAPAPILRLALGEMAEGLLLSSARVIPSKLLHSDYQFRFTDLGEFLRYTLGRDRKRSEDQVLKT